MNCEYYPPSNPNPVVRSVVPGPPSIDLDPLGLATTQDVNMGDGSGGADDPSKRYRVLTPPEMTTQAISSFCVSS